MKNILITLVLVTTYAIPAFSATKTVTLTVSGMTCAACPITVKKALGRVDGVVKAEVSFGRREAVVTFDDAETNVAALARATAEAGYPSIAVENDK
ncbi:MAG: mercury resistance system periplasmic binding protein MerP [Methylotenera sp.]